MSSDNEIKEIISNLFKDIDDKMYNKQETVHMISAKDYTEIKAKWLK